MWRGLSSPRRLSPNHRRCVQQLFLTRLLEDILYSRPQWEYSPHVFSLRRIHYCVMDDSQRTQGVTGRSRGAFKRSRGCGLWPRVQTRCRFPECTAGNEGVQTVTTRDVAIPFISLQIPISELEYRPILSVYTDIASSFETTNSSRSS